MNEIQKKSAFFYFVSEIAVGSVSKLDLFYKILIVIYGDILCKPISIKMSAQMPQDAFFVSYNTNILQNKHLNF